MYIGFHSGVFAIHTTPSPTSLVARLSGIRVDVHRTTVLRDLDLEVVAGEVVGVLGANGSGKSTMLGVLATLVRPAAGGIELFGQPMSRQARATARARIGLVGHTPALYDRLTLAENLRLVARLTGRGEGHADAALARVGLSGAAHRPAVGCSQGMRRRAELARVLLTEPDLLLLDEVHAGLDADAVPLVADIVGSVTGRAGACVLVTHEPDRVGGLCDRLVRVRGGLIEEVVDR